MINEIASCSDRTVKITGPVASGKTEALVQRAAALLRAGLEPDDILVVCTTSFAATSFSARLVAAVDDSLKGAAAAVKVQTALTICADMLARPEIQAITGRTGRLITRHEYNFILEDMKTTGMARREIRKMLGTFAKNWADFEPEENWYLGDNKEVCDILLRFACLLGGVIKEEVPYLCARTLKSEAGAPYCASYQVVLVDDYQNLSHAEQIAMSLHAGSQIVVAGNPNEQGKTGSDYPNPDGFAKFEALRRGVTTFELAESFGNADNERLANTLALNESMPAAVAATSFDDDADGEGVTLIKWTTPKEELLGLTKVLRDEFNRDIDLHERDVCIVVPNKRWGRMYESALLQRGFQVSFAGVISGFGGDPRHTATCPALVAYTKLNLIAHPDDAMAWRCWCGLDDYLTNSQSWEGLYAMAEGEHGVVAALDKVAVALQAGKPNPFPRSHVLAERYLEGRKLISHHNGRRGFALMEALGASNLPEFRDIVASIDGDETAEQLFAVMRRQLISPTFPEAAHVIRLSTFANMHGTNYKTIIMPALVDGYMPNRDAFEVVATDKQRKAVRDVNRRELYGALGKASKRLILSYFQKCDLELAERTKMQVGRIRSENGERIALARPCCFFGEFDDAAPGTISGQKYLSDRELN